MYGFTAKLSVPTSTTKSLIDKIGSREKLRIKGNKFKKNYKEFQKTFFLK